jgi:hypothetical protein
MMVEDLKDISMPSEEEDYELLPHKEIEELKGELQKLKDFEITPTKKLRLSLLELNKKIDRLLNIFDEAAHTIKAEEMGLTFKERMKPMSDKMDKILEQNADIAEGIVAIADMVKGMKGKGMEREEELGAPEFDLKPEFPMPMQRAPAPGVPPPMPPRQMGPMPNIPAPPRRPRTFGII